MDLLPEEAARLLAKAEDILLLAHKSPDGDTLGSCFALYHALTRGGKRVRVACSDEFPRKYGYFLPEAMPDFAPRFIAAVDVADEKLLGPKTEVYAGRVDLCIDHHPTNTRYARASCIDARQAATAQLVFKILLEMGAPITPLVASCLFTGIATDTGCFRYTSVTAETHRIAAALIEAGADAGEINRVMFEQKSRRRMEVERLVMESLEFDYGGRCATIVISQDILRRTGASEDELDGVSAIPRRIEGVWVGVTFNEREGGYKLSVRTDKHVDASAFCAVFGGGGHKRAAGCFIEGDLAAARARVHGALGRFLT